MKETRPTPLLKPENDFLQIVEAHERGWGTKRYAGRPTLQALLDGPIVAVWTLDNEPRHILTVHIEFRELEIIFYRQMFRPKIDQKEADRRKIARLYQNRERMVIKNLRIEFVPLVK